ncbi:hypothetical protein BDW22DRAFT_1428569 [Trametopsis cervina]|nr:hypothetical protein BDW22DRAFT_1428569 [Trametopsis cervina]
MDAADSRTRSKVMFDTEGKKPYVALPQVALQSVVFVLAIALTKDNLLRSHGDVLWLTFSVLATGSVAALVGAIASGQVEWKKIEWPAAGLASFLLMLRLVSLFLAMSQLHPVRVVVLAHMSSLWVKSVIDSSNRYPAMFVLLGLVFSFVTDAGHLAYDFRGLLLAYIAIALEALASSIADHTQGVLLPTLGPFATHGITIVGAFSITSVFYICSVLMSAPPHDPMSTTYAVVIVPILSYSLLYIAPSLTRHMRPSSRKRDIVVSYIVACGAASSLGWYLFSQRLRSSDVIVAGLLCYGITSSKDDIAIRLPYSSLSRLAQGYLKSILENPESRKIFYFLVLNMCYMLVQMLYGIWTNSLGLISDAIHMAFDCMAIGVGLLASVMARWAPNERFTYGYGRIETLSGFSNGIFLILISIFIIFEAIERLMNPPEMNTSQLLLVSTVGLCVNLFGMFAMGGHHHHGGHSHSHGHSHSSSPKPMTTQDRSESQASGDKHTHGAPPLTVDIGVASQHSNQHSHSQVSTRSPETSHHMHDEPHSHQSHDTVLAHGSIGLSHSRSHSHSHSPSLSSSHLHTQTQLRSSSHSHVTPSSPSDHSHPHSHIHNTGNNGLLAARHLSHVGDSPITPNYRFEHDDHYEEHHYHQHGPNIHDHAHMHDHKHEGHSHNMRGVFLHVMADTLGSVGVIISTLLIQLYGWTGFDPIASLFIAILIAASVIPLVIDTGKVLMLDLSHRTSAIDNALSTKDWNHILLPTFGPRMMIL